MKAVLTIIGITAMCAGAWGIGRHQRATEYWDAGYAAAVADYGPCLAVVPDEPEPELPPGEHSIVVPAKGKSTIRVIDEEDVPGTVIAPGETIKVRVKPKHIGPAVDPDKKTTDPALAEPPSGVDIKALVDAAIAKPENQKKIKDAVDRALIRMQQDILKENAKEEKTAARMMPETERIIDERSAGKTQEERAAIIHEEMARGSTIRSEP